MADTIMQPTNLYAETYAAAQPGDDVILALWTTERPEKFGMVNYADGIVAAIVDKPEVTDLTEMWGAIIWRPRFTEYLHSCVQEQGISDFALIMNSAMSAGLKFRAVHLSAGTYIDLGTYDEIMELDRRFREE